MSFQTVNSLLHILNYLQPPKRNEHVAICLFSALLLCFSAATLHAAVTIHNPVDGEAVSSPFTLSASADFCSSQPVRSLGYSLDNSRDTAIFRGSTTIDVRVAASPGPHTVHVKAWSSQGDVCISQVSITVASSSLNAIQSSTVTVPQEAVPAADLQALNGWISAQDNATTGQASGQTQIVQSPSRSGAAREFVTSYSDGGAERYSVTFGRDTASTNFFYDGWIYLASSSKHIANLELDINQTMPNGRTVIFGVQCDGYSNTWDYTENLGTAENPSGNWAHSNARCNVRNWSIDTWHHIQVSYSRDPLGNVTYRSLWFDDAQSDLNVTVFDARSLGWGPNLSTNFQIDGRGSSGSSTVYLDDLTIYRW